jgi:hypothetical protein
VELTDQHVTWRPNPGPQTFFIQCPIFEILLGGARGGGKTAGVLGEWLNHASTYGENANGLMIRRSLVELQDTIRESKVMYYPLGAVYNETGKKWTMSNGATLTFAFLENDEDAQRYQGFSATRLYVEEIGNFPNPDPIMKLKAILRSSKGVPVGFRATGNPGGPGHCVPFGEVLTEAGWVDIRNIQVGEKVYSVDCNGALILSDVEQTHSKHYEGAMVYIGARGLSMTMTPNHKIGVIDRDEKIKFIEWENTAGQITVLRAAEKLGGGFSRIHVRDSKKRKRLIQPNSLSGIQYSALVGWLVSEGCLCKRDKGFSIAQSKKNGREKIKKLLDECGFKQCWGKTQVIVHSNDWYEHFLWLGYCREKRLPKIMAYASKAELQSLIDAMMAGDGHWELEGRSGTYFTISQQLADDFSSAAFRSGYLVSSRSRQRKNRRGLSYEISIKKVKSRGCELLTGHHCYNVKTITKRRSDIEEKDFNGSVYCIGVKDTHNFVIRQNGSVWVSGNSWVKARYIDPAPNGYKIIQDDNGLERDNPSLLESDPMYIQRLQASGSKELVRAWLEGDWSVITGAYFPEFSTATHVIPYMEPPEYWTRICGMDWGSAAPFAVLWAAISDGTPITDNYGLEHFYPKDSLLIYREWYGWNGTPNKGCRMTAEEVGSEIRRIEQAAGEDMNDAVLDPAAFASDGGPSIAERLDCNFRRADNKRVARLGISGGWDALRERLRGNDLSEHKPLLYFMENCVHTIRTLPALQHDPVKPEDVNSQSDDHCADSLRYLCLSRPITKTKVAVENRRYETQLTFNELVKRSRTRRLNSEA